MRKFMIPCVVGLVGLSSCATNRSAAAAKYRAVHAPKDPQAMAKDPILEEPARLPAPERATEQERFETTAWFFDVLFALTGSGR